MVSWDNIELFCKITDRKTPIDVMPELMAKYALSDIVVFKCSKPDCDHSAFYVTTEQLHDADGWINCEYCDEPCDRLLTSNQWQTQVERDKLNIMAQT